MILQCIRLGDWSRKSSTPWIHRRCWISSFFLKHHELDLIYTLCQLLNCYMFQISQCLKHHAIIFETNFKVNYSTTIHVGGCMVPVFVVQSELFNYHTSWRLRITLSWTQKFISEFSEIYIYIYRWVKLTSIISVMKAF